MTREEILNTPELVDFMLDESVIADSREKLRKRLEKVCNLAIKALEQESVIDKIRAEIEKAVWEDAVVSSDGTDEVRIPRLDPDDVFEILDKYQTESEDNNE